MIQTTQLKWWQLIVPIALILIYCLLSYLAFFDHNFFFQSMNMPAPNHDFLIWSWGGKNTAIVVALLLTTLARNAQMMVIILIALLVMQLGDINAGVRTNVDVFVTYIAMFLVAIEFGLLLLGHRKFNNS